MGWRFDEGKAKEIFPFSFAVSHFVIAAIGA
jgi:hypothetical protein